MTGTRNRLTPTGSSCLVEDFLSLNRKDRAARLLGTPRLPRPSKASIDGDGNLTYKWASPATRQVIPATLCFKFAELAEAPDEKIREFTQRWGPLGIECGLLQTAEEWRRYARLARFILGFPAELYRGERGNPEFWRDMERLVPMGKDWVSSIDLTFKRSHGDPKALLPLVGMAINEWVKRAKGIALVTVSGGRLVVRPHGANLFGILVLQLAHAAARVDELAVCAGCPNSFRPKRPPSSGQRQYCQSCRENKIPQRDAARDYRKRMKRSPPKELARK